MNLTRANKENCREHKAYIVGDILDCLLKKSGIRLLKLRRHMSQLYALM